MEGQNFSIVIAGGGSAGWMSAVFLSAVFDLGNNEDYRIILLESQEVPPIGVGESTVHTMRNFLGAAGLDEGDFLLKTDATLKHGILFRDWLHAPGPEGNHHYFHSFEGYPPISPQPMVCHWINARLAGLTTDRYDRWAGIQGVLAAAGRSPKSMQDRAFEAPVPYGYHLDANKFAHYLKSIGLARGVEHRTGHIADVALTAAGAIEKLILDNGEEVPGDLFIDCTGFANVLGRRVGSRFQSCSEHLLCDRAVTVRLPQDQDSYVPRCFTTATARDSGWTFDIDLVKRKGIGYIYSGRHLSPEGAEAQFRTFYPDIPAASPVNHLAMRVGRVDEAWKKNCISIGLSGGFLEPLESTGLYFIELALRLFVDYFTPHQTAESSRKRYNELTADIFDETMEFIVLHYILSRRQDSAFWRSVQEDTRIPEPLSNKLELWTHKPPTDSDFTGGNRIVFQAPNYAAILYGMASLPSSSPGSVRHISGEKSLEYHRQLEAIQRSAISVAPLHQDFLSKYTSAFL